MKIFRKILITGLCVLSTVVFTACGRDSEKTKEVNIGYLIM